MFVDFNKVFKEKKPTEHTIPPALLEYFSNLLPKNLRYTVDKNNNCLLVSEKESMDIGGFKVAPTAEQIKILGEYYTVKDVLNYCENSQQPIPLKLEKEGFISLNGEEVSIDKLFFNPFNPLQYISGTFYMYPHKFPGPFPVTLGYNDYQITVTVKRVPNNSISIAAFESDCSKAIYIKYFIDLTKNTMTFSMSINTTIAKTIKDIVSVISIYNAFIEGKGTFNNIPFNISLETDNVKKIDQRTLCFWEKILKIEEVLNVSFVPPHGNIDSDSIYMVEELYQNLINHKPVRDNDKIDSISNNWEFSNPDKDLKDLVGKSIVFQFEATENIELFGVKLQLPALVGIFNSVVKDFSITEDSKYKITLVDESEDKERYTSIICFKTEEELLKNKSSDFNKMVDLLHDAKSVQEYLQVDEKQSANNDN